MKLKQFATALAASAFTTLAMAQTPSPDRVLDVNGPIVNRGNGTSCAGPLLIDQQPNQSNGIFSDSDCDFCNGGAGGAQVLAENFTLASDAVIGELVIWGGFFPTNVPGPEDWTVIFHADNAGAPGAAINTQMSVPSSRVDTGLDLFGVDEYQWNIAIAPVNLTAGTYHLEIFANTTSSTESIFWEVGNNAAGNPVGHNFAFEAPGVTWNPDAANDLAMQICGPLPPPAIVPTMSRAGLLVLAGVMLVGGVLVMRRRANG